MMWGLWICIIVLIFIVSVPGTLWIYFSYEICIIAYWSAVPIGWHVDRPLRISRFGKPTGCRASPISKQSLLLVCVFWPFHPNNSGRACDPRVTIFSSYGIKVLLLHDTIATQFVGISPAGWFAGCVRCILLNKSWCWLIWLLCFYRREMLVSERRSCSTGTLQREVLNPDDYFRTSRSNYRRLQFRRMYRYGLALLLAGVLCNWIGFAQNYFAPVRYLGVGCVLAGALCVCIALCRWLTLRQTEISQPQVIPLMDSVHSISFRASRPNRPAR